MNKEEFLIQRMKMIQAAVDLQSEDAGLWFKANYIGEAVLQQALRNLHRVIEDGCKDSFKCIKDCAEISGDCLS